MRRSPASPRATSRMADALHRRLAAAVSRMAATPAVLAAFFMGFTARPRSRRGHSLRPANAIRLWRRFFTVPVDDGARDPAVEGDLLIVRERVTMDGSQPVEVMWGHHATFGSDLLAGPFEITTGAKRATVDRAYDPPANPLAPGAEGEVAGRAGEGSGPVDLANAGGAGLRRWPSCMTSTRADRARPGRAVRRLDDAHCGGALMGCDASLRLAVVRTGAARPSRRGTGAAG